MAGQDLDIDALIRRIRRTDVSGLQGALTTMGKVQFWSSLAKKCRKSRNYREVCDPISWVSSLGQPYFARAPPSSWERLTAPLVRAFVMDGSAATPALLELAACLPSTTAAGEGGEGEGVDLVRLRREENSRQRTAFHCLDLALPYTRLFRTEQQRIDFMRRICKPASEGGCDYMDWVAAALLRNRRVDFEQTGPLAAMFPSLSFPNHRHPSIVVGARTNPEAWHSIAAALRRWGTAPAAECADFDAPPSEFHHQWLARYLDELVSRDQDSLLPLFNELLPEGTVLVPDHVDGYDVPSWLSVKWIAVERNNAARVMYRLAMHAARRPRELAAIIASKRMWSVIAHALDGGIPAQLMDETAAHCCAAVAGMFARLTASEIVVRAPGEPLPNVAPFEAVAHEQVEGNTTAFVYLLVAPFLDVQSVVSLAAACRTARDALFSDGVDDPDGSPRFNRAAAYAWAYIGANTVVERNGGKQLIRALARGFHDSCEPQQMQEEHPDDYERIVGIIGSDRPSVVLDDVGVTPEEAKRRLATLSPGHRETVPPILTHFIIASTRVQHLHDDEPEPPPMHWEERSQQIPTEVLSSAGVALVRLALLPGVARRLAAIRFDVDEDDSAAADAAADNDVAGNEATGAAGAGGAGSAAGGARTPPDDAGDDAESLAKGALSSLLAIILRCTLVEWPALLPEIFRSLYVRPPTGQTPAQCVNLLVTLSGPTINRPPPPGREVEHARILRIFNRINRWEQSFLAVSSNDPTGEVPLNGDKKRARADRPFMNSYSLTPLAIAIALFDALAADGVNVPIGEDVKAALAATRQRLGYSFKALGNENFKQRRYDQAIQVYTAALLVRPPPLVAASAVGNRAEAWLSVGAPGRAMRDAHIALATLASLAGDDAAALAAKNRNRLERAAAMQRDRLR